MSPYTEYLAETLEHAVLHNDLLQAQQALWRGANPDTTDERHTPMLHLAITSGDDDMVLVLLKAGAKPYTIDASCRSAVTLAQRMGRREAAALMSAA